MADAYLLGLSILLGCLNGKYQSGSLTQLVLLFAPLTKVSGVLNH